VIEQIPEGVAVYNVAGDERPTLAEWVAVAAQAGGFPDRSVLAGANAEPYKPRQYFPFRDYAYCVEIDVIKAALGWRPRYSLAEGLRHTHATQDIRLLEAKRLDTRIEDHILSTLRRGR
jgi:nucleoside-diphosphate-sugar epimerase